MRAVAFSPEGDRLAVTGLRTLRLFEASSGTELLARRVRGIGQSVAFSPDGGVVAVGLYSEVRLFDAASGEEIYSLRGSIGPVLSLVFSPGGGLLAGVGGDAGELRTTKRRDDKLVHLWDPRTGRRAMLPLQGHSDTVMCVAFSPDGSLASGSRDSTIRLWNPDTGEAVGAPLSGHTRGPVSSVAFSPDGTRLVSSGSDRTIRVWDPATGEQLGPPLNAGLRPAHVVAFAPERPMAVSAGTPQLGAALGHHSPWGRGQSERDRPTRLVDDSQRRWGLADLGELRRKALGDERDDGRRARPTHQRPRRRLHLGGEPGRHPGWPPRVAPATTRRYACGTRPRASRQENPCEATPASLRQSRSLPAATFWQVRETSRTPLCGCGIPARARP